MKKLVIISALISMLGLSFVFAQNSSATNNSCTPVDKYIIKTSDSTNEEVNFDFQNSNNTVVITVDSGYTVTEVWLDVSNDGHSGYYQYGTNTGTYNPNPGDSISSAKVRVVKVCATATPTASPTPQSVSVNICHQAGQSGNYTHNTVSVHSVNDANGLNGHGGHGGDIWAPFTYNNVNYPGQGNYGSFNMTTCVQNSTPTATPTSTPTATPVSTWTPSPTPFSTWTPTATPTSQSTYSPTPTATPTDDPCEEENECNESTPTPEATATPTPNGDICANLDGIQLTMPDEYHQAGENCLKYELGGPPPPPAVSNNQVLGASTTGKVLGASTMAGTGAVEDAIFNSMFTLGSLLTSFGIMKNGKKKS